MKNKSIKLLLVILLIDQYFIQSSEKLPPAADEYRCRDTDQSSQKESPWNAQQKMMSPSNSSFQSTWKLVEQMGDKILKQKVWGLHGSTRGPICINYSFRLSIFMRFLSVWMSGSLWLLCLLLGLFPSAALPCSAWMGWFFFSFIKSNFVMFGCYRIEACSILTRDPEEVDLEGREVIRNWEE